MKENSGRQTCFWKWVIIVFCILFLVTGITAVYISKTWKPMLTQKIKEEVYNGSNHLYHLNFKDIHLNVITGTAVLDSVSLTPDLSVFNQFRKKQIAPTHLFNIKLANLNLNRIRIYDTYYNKELRIASIVLNRPSINMIFNKVVKQKDSVKAERNLYQLISKTLKTISVSKVRVIDADFEYVSGATGMILKAVKHLNVNVDDFLLDSISQNDPSRFYYTRDISFELAGYESLTKDKMYTLKVDTVVGSATGRTIKIQGLKLIPMYKDITFSRKYATRKDRYDLSFKHIQFSGVNFNRFNQDGIFHAKLLKVGPAKVSIFLNRELPSSKISKGKNFPHMNLKKLPLTVIIDTLNLNKLDITYVELDSTTHRRGTLTLNKLSGKILNVTNDSIQLSKNHYALAKVNTLIQNAISTKVTLNFDLKAKNGAFTYQGTIGHFDMKLLNPLSKYLGHVEIETGNVDKVFFNMQANNVSASGTVLFKYKDLKVKLLKAGEDGAPLKTKKFLSFIANNFVVNDANPSNNGLPRTATVSYERIAGASFFSFIWKSIFSGIRDIVGLGIKPMKGQRKIKD